MPTRVVRVRGHPRRTSRGYTRVRPYQRRQRTARRAPPTISRRPIRRMYSKQPIRPKEKEGFYVNVLPENKPGTIIETGYRDRDKEVGGSLDALGPEGHVKGKVDKDTEVGGKYRSLTNTVTPIVRHKGKGIG